MPDMAYRKLMDMLAPEGKDVLRTLTRGDFTCGQLLLCDFEKLPTRVQWEVIWTVQKANSDGEFCGMQKAQRVRWFANVLKSAAASSDAR